MRQSVSRPRSVRPTWRREPEIAGGGGQAEEEGRGGRGSGAAEGGREGVRQGGREGGRDGRGTAQARGAEGGGGTGRSRRRGGQGRRERAERQPNGRVASGAREGRQGNLGGAGWLGGLPLPSRDLGQVRRGRVSRRRQPGAMPGRKREPRWEAEDVRGPGTSTLAAQGPVGRVTRRRQGSPKEAGQPEGGRVTRRRQGNP